MNEATTHAPNPLAQLRKDIKAALPTFGLRNEREQERMSSVLMVAVERDPDLVFADRQSLIAAVRQCANHGLVPDGNEATLQVYNSKVKRDGVEKWVKKVQYQPMVRGIINRVLRSGKVLSFWAEIVYKGEEFRIDTSQGDRRPIHDPDHFNRSGDIIGVYAVAKLSNGTIDCEPMNMAQIQKVRNVAKTKNVWDNWFEEKAKVAVMRRLSKRLPLSSEDMDFIMNSQEHDLEAPKDVTPKEEARPNLAQRITGATEATQEADPDPTRDPREDVEDAQEVRHVIDVECAEYKSGVMAGEDGKDKEPPFEPGSYDAAQWLAGYESVLP